MKKDQLVNEESGEERLIEGGMGGKGIGGQFWLRFKTRTENSAGRSFQNGKQFQTQGVIAWENGTVGDGGNRESNEGDARFLRESD